VINPLMQQSSTSLKYVDAVNDTDQKLAVAQQNYNNASFFNKAKFVCAPPLLSEVLEELTCMRLGRTDRRPPKRKRK